MRLSNPTLWRRIQDFAFDAPDCSRTFAARLAAGCGWSNAYAARVIGEYRKFLYLSATAGHRVSPSSAVDQVWHLHLTYTRNYWGVLCEHILQRPLHHEPSDGSKDDSAKHRDRYRKTRDSYLREFGIEPPSDIWPAPCIRPLRVKSHRTWIGGAIAATAVAALGATTSGGTDGGMVCLAVSAVIFVTACLIVVIRDAGRGRHQHENSRDSTGCCGSMIFCGSGASGGKGHDTSEDGDGDTGGGGCSSGCGGD